METLDRIRALSIAGVYCLHSNGYAYFGYSTDILSTVAGIMKELRDGTFKIMDMRTKTLDLHVFAELSGGVDIETFKLRTQYIARKWEEEGYVLWNPAIKSLLKYEVVSKVSLDHKSVYVLLKTASRTEKVVGVFDTRDEAEEFKGKYYSPEANPMMLPVFACNSRTSEELCKHRQGKSNNRI